MAAEISADSITAIVSGLVGGVLIALGARRQEKRAEASPPEKPEKPHGPQVELPPVPDDPAGQRELMALFQRDNHDLREEIAGYRAEVADFKRLVEQMKEDLEADKDWKVRFLDALGRYLSKIFAGWDHSRPFPLPEPNDLALLQDIVPQERT